MPADGDHSLLLDCLLYMEVFHTGSTVYIIMFISALNISVVHWHKCNFLINIHLSTHTLVVGTSDPTPFCM